MIDVVNYIINNGTADKPVMNHQISTHFNISEINVRKLINQARCAGVPICSCSKGYYYSENKADIVATIQSLNNRTISVERAISGLLTSLIGSEDNEDD